MKVLFTSDLHGEIHLFQELFSLANSSFSKIILIGGDLLPSFPPTNRYDDLIPNQKKFISDFLLPFFNKILETTPVEKILLIPGNWDLGYSSIFKKPEERIIDLNQRSFCLKNGYELIGYPYVPPTPFRPKTFEKMDDREAPLPPQKNPSYTLSPDQTDQLIPIDSYLFLARQDTIGEDLDRLPKPLYPEKTIYMMHSPPFQTRLDRIQGMKPVGSRAIKSFIKTVQPLLTLHGHIHESPEISGSYMDEIGRTLSINPGQSVGSIQLRRKLHAITFEMERIKETLQHTYYPSALENEVKNLTRKK